MKTLLALLILSQFAVATTVKWATAPKSVKQLHAVMNQENCDMGEDAPTEIEMFNLGRDRALYLVGCSSGAYNMTSVGYIVENKSVTPVSILTVQVDDEGNSWIEPTFSLGNAHYDPKKEELTTMFKGRGLGDCGTSNVTKIFMNDWGGVSVKTTEVRSQQECNEQFDKQWPLVFKQ